MPNYQNFDINESAVLGQAIILTEMLIIVAAATVFFVIYCFDRTSTKTKRRIKRLGELAATDERAQKQLDSLNRKEQRRRKNKRHDRVFNVSVLVLSCAIMTLTAVLGVIPAWQDYLIKDYVIYEGEYETKSRTIREHWLELEDGTEVLSRRTGLDTEEQRAFVYSKRTRLVVGWKNTEQ